MSLMVNLRSLRNCTKRLLSFALKKYPAISREFLFAFFLELHANDCANKRENTKSLTENKNSEFIVHG